MSSVEPLPSTEGDGVSLLLRGAEVAARQRRDAEARRLLKAALRHNPTNAQALLTLVYLAEDGQAGLVYLTRLLNAHPHHPQARTAIRWARRRVPTSHTPTGFLSMEAAPSWRRARAFAYGVLAVTVLFVLGLLLGLSQKPAALVQADSTHFVPPSLPTIPTATPIVEVISVGIPLFTLTPTPSPEPTPTPIPSPTPNSAAVPVLGRPQTYNLSCESRSAADLAGFWGVSVGELEFLSALGYSDNPHKGFVGDPTWPPGSLPPHGYGVYVEPVAATLRAFGLDARPVYNLGLDGLRAELLAGRPVLIWATYRMELYEPFEWSSSDGRVSTVVPFMHTFIVTGFSEEELFFIDAYDGTEQRYSDETFLTVWNLFDQMALTVSGTLP